MLAWSLQAARSCGSPRQTRRWFPTTMPGYSSIPRQIEPRSRPRFKRLQPVWSMGTRNPKTRHANQLYLDEIPALRKATSR